MPARARSAPDNLKNRLHIDIQASGDLTDPIEARKERLDAEAGRLMGLGAVITVVMCEEGIDHYAVGMKDPEERVRHQLTRAR
ncbi:MULTISPECIES: hypothetical protein [unclassified Streptomyces]|uniref:hypothetical protein n=1 Tax=unclassified Streptomyces TaxID=2593676 RepID=UPI0033CAB976